MTSLDPGMRVEERGVYQEPSGEGWLLFAGIMVVIVGVLNVIYGIAAIGNSSFFVNDQKYILSNLNTWGWVTLILGVLQILAAFSIWRGGQFGRWFGIIAAGLRARSGGQAREHARERLEGLGGRLVRGGRRLVEDRVGALDGGAPGRGQLDQLGPPVLGMGRALHQSALLEAIDDQRDVRA